MRNKTYKKKLKNNTFKKNLKLILLCKKLLMKIESKFFKKILFFLLDQCK